MKENHTINLVEIPIRGKGGFIWNRLHGERENICETLLKHSGSVREQQEALQARLRKVDDALDRLMSGSYGRCSECGHEIDETRLDIDPALSLCLDCRNRQATPDTLAARDYEETDELLLKDLNPFDTINLRTHHSDYRILLLDPKTGRALVEGGHYLLEPNEALLQGSAFAGDALKPGAICVGCRLEMWVGERVFLTSPVKTVRVKHNDVAESLHNISTALH